MRILHLVVLSITWLFRDNDKHYVTNYIPCLCIHRYIVIRHIHPDDEDLSNVGCLIQHRHCWLPEKISSHLLPIRPLYLKQYVMLIRELLIVMFPFRTWHVFKTSYNYWILIFVSHFLTELTIDHNCWTVSEATSYNAENWNLSLRGKWWVFSAEKFDILFVGLNGVET